MGKNPRWEEPLFSCMGLSFEERFGNVAERSRVPTGPCEVEGMGHDKRGSDLTAVSRRLTLQGLRARPHKASSRG